VADTPKPLHSKQRSGPSALVIGLVVVAVIAVAGAAYAASRNSGSGSGGSGSASATPTTAESINLLVQPPDGSTNVSLDTIISVTAVTGRLTGVTVAGADGAAVAGSLTSGGTAWRSSASLALKTDYTVTIDAAMPSGKATEQVTHFKSLVPTATLGVTITPATGLTVGVAQPIVLRFDHTVTNKDALMAQLHVTASPPVSGGWHWFSSKELHFRPQQYWPTGQKVTVTADLKGFNAGGGVWGASTSTSSFAVGDSHISTANVQTHVMTVTSNGAVVATYPLSAGRTKYPTMGGVHIDLYRQQDVHMVSSSVGIAVNSADGYDEHVYWDVNISDGGEYVHAAPWSTGAQGNSNVSHGCINLSPTNAQAFYNFSRIGDVIEVTGSPRGPDLGDHGTMDWNLAWSSWTPATIGA
jgi:lipoprotein-anchoring transpeptidase ErfK/SrfK